MTGSTVLFAAALAVLSLALILHWLGIVNGRDVARGISFASYGKFKDRHWFFVANQL